METAIQSKPISVEKVKNIDSVIALLDEIIEETKTSNNPLGYFAALYRKVTIRVKEGIANGVFEDGHRMERLDVIFASRYLDAYNAYQTQKKVTKSWQKAFVLSTKFWPIVLQHLLIGMNAHINLDLGVAAAEVMEGKNINHLKKDFDRINGILSSLVHDVEQELSEIWPTLKTLLKWTGSVDNFLVNFSMEIARDGAWDFAVTLASAPSDRLPLLIEKRDDKVAKLGKLVSHPGWLITALFKIIRLGEKGTVAQKIEDLAN